MHSQILITIVVNVDIIMYLIVPSRDWNAPQLQIKNSRLFQTPYCLYSNMEIVTFQTDI